MIGALKLHQHSLWARVGLIRKMIDDVWGRHAMAPKLGEFE